MESLQFCETENQMFSLCFKSHFAFKDLGNRERDEPVIPNYFKDWFSCSSPRLLQQNLAVAGSPAGQDSKKDTNSGCNSPSSRDLCLSLLCSSLKVPLHGLTLWERSPTSVSASTLTAQEYIQSQLQSKSNFSVVWLFNMDSKQFPVSLSLLPGLSGCQQKLTLHTAAHTEPVLTPRCLLPPHPKRLARQLAAFLEEQIVTTLLHQAKSVMLP